MGKRIYKNGWKSTLPKCKICGKRLSTRKAVMCKKCYGISMRGKNNPFYGKHHSEESKNKWRKSRAWWRKYKDGYKSTYPNCRICGKKLTSRTYGLCGKCYAINMRKKGLFSGRKHSIETKKKMSEIQKRIVRVLPHHSGKDASNWKGGLPKCVDCGKTLSRYDTKRCLHCNNLGERANNWKGGITPLHQFIRNLEQATQWKKEVLQRDNYTCQGCGLKSETGNFNLMVAHHKKQFSNILQEFLQEYDQFSPIEDKETLARLAIKYKPFWDIDNGKTLCEKCHYLTYPGPKKLNPMGGKKF